MNTKTRWILSTLAFAIVGLLIEPHSPSGAMIWGEPAEDPDEAGPTSAQLGLLMAITLVQVVGFGVGFSVLVHGWKAARRNGTSATVALVAVVWGLVSWVPHGAAHMTIGANLSDLIVVEYVFHLTLVASAAALAIFILKRIRGASKVPASAPVPRIAPAPARPAPVVQGRRL